MTESVFEAGESLGVKNVVRKIKNGLFWRK